MTTSEMLAPLPVIVKRPAPATAAKDWKNAKRKLARSRELREYWRHGVRKSNFIGTV